MGILNRAKKVRTDKNDWQLVRINIAYTAVLQNLGLLPKPEEPPKKEARETEKKIPYSLTDWESIT